ncbi:hypothetical protein Plhal703r1_c31g0121501 [Plasmopara halstedii]
MLIAGSILFLVCSTSAYNFTRSTSSYQTAAGVPVDDVLIANSSSSVLNLSSSHETTNKDVEERANGGLFGKMSATITDLVKGPVPAEYNFYVTSLNKYEDLDAVLTSPEMESLYKFCKEYNDKHKNKLSSVAPVLERFKDKAINNKLHDLAMSADGKQPMMKHLALQHRDNLLMKKNNQLWNFSNFWNLATILPKRYVMENLTSYWGNLVRQIYEVKHRLGENAVNLVGPLKTSLFHQWYKVSLVSVWDRLQFGPEAYDALTSGKLEIFHEYIAEKYPSIKSLVLIEFTRIYGEGSVTEALANAMILPHTKVFASTIYHERLNHWYTHAYSMETVFDLLKFSKTDSANSALFKLESFSDFVWTDFDNSPFKVLHLQDYAHEASVALKENDRLAYHLPVADLQEVLFEVWTHGRIPIENLLRKLRALFDFDRDVSSIPFDAPRRS